MDALKVCQVNVDRLRRKVYPAELGLEINRSNTKTKVTQERKLSTEDHFQSIYGAARLFFFPPEKKQTLVRSEKIVTHVTCTL